MLVCTFPNIGPFLIPTVLPDTVNNRAHYLLTAIDGGAVYIASCDLKTFLLRTLGNGGACFVQWKLSFHETGSICDQYWN